MEGVGSLRRNQSRKTSLHKRWSFKYENHSFIPTRAVHKLLRQRRLKGTWKRYMILHDWTHQLYLFLKYQSYGYTQLFAEGIRKASPRCMQVTMELMRLWQPHFFPMYTPFNPMRLIWRWIHLSYTYVQLISEVQMLLQCCFGVQYPSQSVEHHAVVNLTHSTSNLSYSSLLAEWGRGIFWKTSVPSVD